MRIALLLHPVSILCAGLGLAPLVWSADSQGATVDAPAAGDPTAALADAPLAAYRRDLLEVAFESASAIPLTPHIKNRSRAQEAVVVACLELDQARTALAYVERIDNWRRGVGYADLALYAVEHGGPETLAAVDALIERAREVADAPRADTDQGWRRDRILAKVARTLAALGRAEEAATAATGVTASELGPIELARSENASVEDFAQRIAALRRVAATADFDAVQSALGAAARLVERFYANPERRAEAEAALAALAQKSPVLLRLSVLSELARIAADHDDRARALERVVEMRALIDASRLTPEARIPLVATVARLRCRAGEREAAARDLDLAVADYETEREGIYDIDRADALRPIAEAYHALGDAAAARAIYGLAVEAGALNPNSRPRAEDLVATCVSMAVQGFEPDADLLERVAQVAGALADPW